MGEFWGYGGNQTENFKEQLVGTISMLEELIRAGVTDVESDIVILGTGPVGLAVALQCMGSGRRVLLVESGAQNPDPATFDLASGERALPYSMLPIPSQQARQVGGNSNFWHLHRPDATNGVRLVELDDVAFERRPSTGNVGWPFGKDALRPWYSSAANRFGIVDFPDLPSANGLETDQVTTSFAQVPRASTVFEGWVNQLRDHPDTTFLTGATGTNVLMDPSSSNHAVGLVVSTLAGATATIRAAEFVIAGGGYDNARFLLSQVPVAGTPLGNDEITGRFLQDHPLDFGDYLHMPSSDQDSAVFSRSYDMVSAPDIDAARIAYLTLRSEYAAKHDLLAMSTWIFPRTRAVPIDKGPAAIRFLTGRGVAPTYPGLNTKGPADYVRAASTAARSLKSTIHWLSGERLFTEGTRGPGLNNPGWPQDGAKGRFRTWELVRLIEQPGRAENRVRLSSSRDVLGRKRILIDWSWSAEDAAAARRTKSVLDSALGAYGQTITDEQLALARPGTGHIIGCTRMHPDPRFGVVDENCLVHGTPNLHVVGTSVFPTGSWANPTFTAVALALRLGESLKRTNAIDLRGAAQSKQPLLDTSIPASNPTKQQNRVATRPEPKVEISTAGGTEGRGA